MVTVKNNLLFAVRFILIKLIFEIARWTEVNDYMLRILLIDVNTFVLIL